MATAEEYNAEAIEILEEVIEETEAAARSWWPAHAVW